VVVEVVVLAGVLLLLLAVGVGTFTELVVADKVVEDATLTARTTTR